MPKLKTHEEFLKDLQEKNKHFNCGNFWIKSNYINTQTPIICEDKFGFTESLPLNLLQGQKPSIRSAINPTEYFINRAKEVHGDKYIYSRVKWKSSDKYVQIYCKIHKNYFSQTPNKHLLKKGCPKCGDIQIGKKNALSIDDFKNKAKLIHGDKYGYSNIKYKNNITKVILTCPIHGKFSQKPAVHLRGCGCPKCGDEKISYYQKINPTGWKDVNWKLAGTRSKNFDSFKFYIIKCWNENETFYKIGKTFKTLNKRFFNKTLMPYKFKVLCTIINENAKYICELERDLKRVNKEYKYTPKKKFDGRFECFSKILWKK